MKTYDELIKLKTFEERFRYLLIGDHVGNDKFGSLRYFIQKLYSSYDWKIIRNKAIVRDMGCDIAVPGMEIRGIKNIYVHHIEPLCIEDIQNMTDKVFDLNNLITVSGQTHEAIHFGDTTFLDNFIELERKPGDTALW